MAYWYCCYHIVWTTKYRSPAITSAFEPSVYQWVRDKSAALKSEVFAVNGTADHIHVAVAIPPARAAAEWVKQIKGFTAYELNKMFPDVSELFKWQSAYGIITVGPRYLPRVVEYIERQKQHHAENTIIKSLERIGNEDCASTDTAVGFSRRCNY